MIETMYRITESSYISLFGGLNWNSSKFIKIITNMKNNEAIFH